MPIGITDFFQPASEFVPFLLEDYYIKGGYTVFADLAERDTWTTEARDKFGRFNFPPIDPRKAGALCYVVSEDTIYKLADDLETWEELKLGLEFQTEEPLSFVGDGPDQRLTIDPSRILPPPGESGQILGLDENLIPQWQDAIANLGTRSIVEYEMTEPLESGESHDFAIPDVAKSIMMLKLTVNATDLQVEGFTTPARDDLNPFRFISNFAPGIDLLTDQGIQLQDDLSMLKFRRFSFMSNLEQPPQRTHYFRFTNVGDGPMTPKMTLTYLVIE